MMQKYHFRFSERNKYQGEKRGGKGAKNRSWKGRLGNPQIRVTMLTSSIEFVLFSIFSATYKMHKEIEPYQWTKWKYLWRSSSYGKHCTPWQKRSHDGVNSNTRWRNCIHKRSIISQTQSWMDSSTNLYKASRWGRKE